LKQLLFFQQVKKTTHLLLLFHNERTLREKYFKHKFPKICKLACPFSFDAKKVPANLQLQLTDLQNDYQLKFLPVTGVYILQLFSNS
jgi:hypothetical protein